MKKATPYIILLALLLLAFFYGRYTVSNRVIPFETKTTKTDTLYSTKEVPYYLYKTIDNPIYDFDSSKYTNEIDSLKTALMSFKNDSLYCSKPYLDSISIHRQNDTATVYWSYPPSFKYGIFKAKLDTQKVITNTITITVPQERKFYDNVWFGVAGTVVTESIIYFIFKK